MIKKKIKRVSKRKNTEIYMNKNKKENMEETDTVICPKKRNKK